VILGSMEYREICPWFAFRLLGGRSRVNETLDEYDDSLVAEMRCADAGRNFQ